MILPCGCPIGPGMLVSLEVVAVHKEHTLLAMVIWDLLVQPGATLEQEQAREKLVVARLSYQKALDVAFPSAEANLQWGYLSEANLSRANIKWARLSDVAFPGVEEEEKP